MGVKATAQITTLIAARQQLAVTDLVRMECLVGPLKRADAKVDKEFRSFFTSPDVRVLPITAADCERAARFRAQYSFKPLDSLHLAAAVEHGGTRFLTNDGRLKFFLRHSH